MLFMVISTPRAQPPSEMKAKRQDYWRWLAPLQENGTCMGAWARAGRGAVILFDVPDNETLHRLLNEWAEIIPAHFDTYPLIDMEKAKAFLGR